MSTTDAAPARTEPTDSDARAQPSVVTAAEAYLRHLRARGIERLYTNGIRCS